MTFGRTLSRIGVHTKRYSCQFDEHVLLSEENRKKCIDSMKKVPSIRFKTFNSDVFAAVLIPICVTRAGEVCLLYTRRSPKISRHVRQVSFPGGIKDETDKSLEDCALRETEEEVGLPRTRVQIWGTGDFVRPPHTAAIMPVVGLIENFSIEELVLNRDEVDEAFIVPIRALCSPLIRKHTQFKEGYSAPVFVVSKHKIWGITGFITNMFLSCFLPNNAYDPSLKFIKYYRQS